MAISIFTYLDTSYMQLFVYKSTDHVEKLDKTLAELSKTEI